EYTEKGRKRNRESTRIRANLSESTLHDRHSIEVIRVDSRLFAVPLFCFPCLPWFLFRASQRLSLTSDLLRFLRLLSGAVVHGVLGVCRSTRVAGTSSGRYRVRSRTQISQQFADVFQSERVNHPGRHR